MRIDLALLFTWREVARMKNSVNTNLLIMDEVFDSSLDGWAQKISKDYSIYHPRCKCLCNFSQRILHDKFEM